MKTRNGFVSNSSSASFVLLCRNNKLEGYFTLIDLLNILIGRSRIKSVSNGTIEFEDTTNKYPSSNFSIQTVEQLKRNEEWMPESYQEDIARCETEIVRLKKLEMQDEDVLLAIAKNVGVYHNATKKAVLQAIHDDIARLEGQKKQFETNLKNMLASLKLCDDALPDSVVICIEIDNFDAYKIEAIIEKSNATILRKVVT